MFVQLPDDDEWINLALVERARHYFGSKVCLHFMSGRTVCYDGQSINAILTALESTLILDETKVEQE